jgi:osmoprotectant transport system substrate-binding protein
MPWRALTCFIAALLLAGCPTRKSVIVIGSKNFPEQALLGELLAQQIEARTGIHVERRFYLAGTYICHQALLAGRIDMYVEYTGTALTAVLKEPPEKNPHAVFQRVRTEYARRFHLLVEPPLGFNDSFAIVIRGGDARKDQIRSISQAAKYAPGWRAGFGYEFMERPDGYDGFVKTYGLKFSGSPRIMDLGLLYRALTAHQVDIVAGNTTDGQLMSEDFTVLEDDRHYFPPYQAATIVRSTIARDYPDVITAISELAGKISDQDMQHMNYEVTVQHRDMSAVIREFLASNKM